MTPGALIREGVEAELAAEALLREGVEAELAAAIRRPRPKVASEVVGGVGRCWRDLKVRETAQLKLLPANLSLLSPPRTKQQKFGIQHWIQYIH